MQFQKLPFNKAPALSLRLGYAIQLLQAVSEALRADDPSTWGYWDIGILGTNYPARANIDRRSLSILNKNNAYKLPYTNTIGPSGHDIQHTRSPQIMSW